MELNNELTYNYLSISFLTINNNTIPKDLN